jgi:hypothetical protein
MSTITQAWLDLVPPSGSAPRELGSDAGPGDAITVTMDEYRQLKRLMAMTPNDHAHDVRQAVCRTLGPERVAVVLQNSERGKTTPVNVDGVML